MSQSREWMYAQRLHNGILSKEFSVGLDYFIERATSYPDFMSGAKIKCPCTKCDNIPYKDVNTVKFHLAKYGFVPDYEIWRFQGETSLPIFEDINMDTSEAPNTYRTMVMDHTESQFNINDTEEPPNREAQQLYDMLNAADNELWHGCKKLTQLSLVARLINLKAEHNMSKRCFDQMVELMKDGFPEDNLAPDNFYNTKKLLRGMGLPVEKIDCCPNNCMLYWEHDIDLIRCKFCNTSRYKENSRGSSSNSKNKLIAAKKMYYFPLTPRLQRLYASKATAKEMCCHATSSDDGVMRHPADSPAWKHLNNTFPHFAAEIRNVRQGGTSGNPSQSPSDHL